MTREEAARRYLQASRDSGYQNLPGEAKQAHEDTMRRLERKHAGLREHAIVGTAQDFDKPLDAGLREHQAHLRQTEGLTHSQVLDRRKAIRSGGKPTRPRPPRRAAVRAGARAGRAHYRTSKALRDTGLPAAAGSTGSIVMQAVGIGIGLSLVYLVLSRKGAGAFAGVLNGVTQGLQIFLQPLDPLNPSAARAATTQTQPSIGGNLEGAPLKSGLGAAPHKTTAARNRAFGPGPGTVGTLITPIGGSG